MDKMDRDKKLWGGIFGIVAIVAAIAEVFINGVDTQIDNMIDLRNRIRLN